MFVTEASLDEMLRTVDSSIDPSDRRTLADWPDTDQRSDRRCPQCDLPMSSLVIERMPVERCTAHGVWFDRQELERVLSPNVTPESFGFEHDLRQGAADYMELGVGGVVIRAIYRMIRRRKTATRDE
jgi:Zn-finger nucleic acid-binding protein